MTFDPAASWQLGERVALRPERFGALAYHYETRQLSFLRSTVLARIVVSLSDHASADEALAAAELPEEERQAILVALSRLAAVGMLQRKR